MSEWRFLKCESHTLKRPQALELAARHSGMAHSPVEREVDPSRVKKLVAIIRKGQALPFSWATVDFNGSIVRMNGQHSSAAIVEVGAELPDGLAFHIDHYKADSRHGMIDLFRQFDQRWSSRTSADVCGAHQGLHAELAGCDKKIMKVSAEALSWTIRSVEGLQAPSGDDTYDLLDESRFKDFFVWVNGRLNGRKELRKAQVIAAMYKTYEVSQSGADKFWHEVSLGPDYFTDDSNPGAVLIGELSKALEDKEFRDNEFPVLAIYYKKCIKAWNAFCAGQRISTLKISKAKGWPEISRVNEEAAA